LLAGAARVPDSPRVIGRFDGDDVADLAVKDLFHGFAARAVVAPAEAVNEGEVLGLSAFARLKERAQAGPVDGHGLLDKGIDALFDRIGKVKGAEVWRSGEENQIDLVGDVLVRVEACELTILRDVDARGDRRSLELGKATFEPILEGVGHGDELGARAGGEGLLRRASTSAATADQANLDGAATGGMDQGDRQAGRQRRGRHGRRAFQEITPRSGRGGWRGRFAGALGLRSVSHGGISCLIGVPRREAWARKAINCNRLAHGSPCMCAPTESRAAAVVPKDQAEWRPILRTGPAVRSCGLAFPGFDAVPGRYIFALF
jgi:hypothetical protein